MSTPLWTGLLPADGSNWLPVTTGESGATVLRDTNMGRFAKLVTPEQAVELAGERDRLLWLEEAGVAVGGVLDWRSNDHGACLVTRAVTGTPADQLGADALWEVWPSIINLAKQLHGIDVSNCPFDRGLTTMMSLARKTVADDRVKTDFLPVELQQVAPRKILQHVEDQLMLRMQQESEQAVLCHGDLCLPNILVHNQTRQISGVIDVGRLGRADPYADIALLLANARETWPDAHTAHKADDAFADQYGITLDIQRRNFYLMLDPLTWAR